MTVYEQSLGWNYSSRNDSCDKNADLFTFCRRDRIDTYPRRDSLWKQRNRFCQQSGTRAPSRWIISRTFQNMHLHLNVPFFNLTDWLKALLSGSFVAHRKGLVVKINVCMRTELETLENGSLFARNVCQRYAQCWWMETINATRTSFRISNHIVM